MKLIVREMGLVFLAKEEAQAKERQEAGNPLTPLQELILRLRALNPEQPDFYRIAAAYLRKRFRPNRTYGLFFLFLGSVPLLVGVLYVPPHFPEFLFGVAAYLLFGALGLALFYHSSASVRNLRDGDEGEDADSRIERLRKAALNNQQDPVAALVLELTDQSNNEVAPNHNPNA
jgi:hypothetical protein